MMSSVIKCRTSIAKCLEIKLFYEWKINNFNCSRRNGDFLESPIFSSDLSCNDRWQLYCYPRGTTSDGEIYVGVKLRLISSDEPQIIAQYNLSIVNEDGEIDNTLHSRVCQFKAGEFRGCAKFIKRTELLEQRPTIACCVKMFINENLVNSDARIRSVNERVLRARRVRMLRLGKEYKSKIRGNYDERGLRMKTVSFCRRVRWQMENGTFDMNEVSVSNAAGFLRLVIDSHFLDVRKKIFDFIKEHYAEFTETNGYRVLKERYPEIRSRFLQEVAKDVDLNKMH